MLSAIQRFALAYKVWGVLQLAIPALLSYWAVLESMVAGWSQVAVLATGLLVLSQSALLLAAARYLLNVPTAIVERDPLLFGLSYVGVFTAYSAPSAPRPALQLGVELRNSSRGPLTFVVERLNVVVAGRTASPLTPSADEIVIPMGGNRRFRDFPMSAEMLVSLGVGVKDGSLEMEILYGRFGEPKTRRYKLRLGLTVHLGSASAGVADQIQMERDSEA